MSALIGNRLENCIISNGLAFICIVKPYEEGLPSYYEFTSIPFTDNAAISAYFDNVLDRQCVFEYIFDSRINQILHNNNFDHILSLVNDIDRLNDYFAVWVNDLQRTKDLAQLLVYDLNRGNATKEYATHFAECIINISPITRDMPKLMKDYIIGLALASKQDELDDHFGEELYYERINRAVEYINATIELLADRQSKIVSE